MTSVTHAIMICEPRNKIWKINVEGICGNLTAHFLTLSIIDIFMDIAIWILPSGYCRLDVTDPHIVEAGNPCEDESGHNNYFWARNTVSSREILLLTTLEGYISNV